jgi:membrane associated rhomboid family serine protease
MPARDKTPWATLLLICACLAAAFASALDPDITLRFAFQPLLPSALTAFTSLFLHAGPLHLLGNMVFLAGVGPLIELADGRLRLVLVFLLGGLAGVGAHAAFGPEISANQPVVGASGAVAAGVGYVLLRHIDVRVPIWRGVGVPVGIVAAFWAAVQVFAAFVQASGAEMGSVSHWSHLGGLVFGLAVALAFGVRKRTVMSHGHKVLDEMNQRGPGAALHAAEAAARRNPGDLAALKARAQALEDLGEPEAAAAWLEAMDASSGEARLEALAGLGRVKALGQIEPTRRMRLAHEAAPLRPLLAEEIYRSVAEDPDAGAEEGHALLAWAGLLRGRDPVAAQDILARLQERCPMHSACDLARQRGWIE